MRLLTEKYSEIGEAYVRTLVACAPSVSELLAEERVFAEQMSRFLPPDVRRQMVDDLVYRQTMARVTREMFERVLDAF